MLTNSINLNLQGMHERMALASRDMCPVHLVRLDELGYSCSLLLRRQRLPLLHSLINNHRRAPHKRPGNNRPKLNRFLVL